MQVKVRFSVEFETTIEVPDDENVWDAVQDIEIPEKEGVSYKEDSYEVLSVYDENGKEL